GSELILVCTLPATWASLRSLLATLADFEQPLIAAIISSNANVRTAPADLNFINLSFSMSPLRTAICRALASVKSSQNRKEILDLFYNPESCWLLLTP